MTEEAGTQEPQTKTPRWDREFGKLWIASGISNLGDGIMLAAAPLLAATLTRDPFLVAFVVFCQRLPWLLFALLSGAFVDRVDRRRLMSSVDVFRTGLIGVLGVAVWGGWATVPLLCVIFFLVGTAETLFDNASQAILPQVVPKDRLGKANGRLQGTRLLANELAGPPLGALLFAVAASIPFLLNAGSFAAAAALVLALRGKFKVERRTDASRTTLTSEILEGLEWLFRRRLLRTLAAMSAMMNLAYAAGVSILVLYAGELLSLSALGYGLLLSCGAIGGVAGSLVSERIAVLLGEGRALFCVLLTGVLVYAVIAAVHEPIIVGAMIALEGFAAVVWNVIVTSLRQSLVPGRLLGRVSSSYMLLSFGGWSVGALLGGLVAKSFGLAAPFWMAGILLALATLLVYPIVNNKAVAEVRAGEASEQGSV